MLRARSPHPDLKIAPNIRVISGEWNDPILRGRSQLSKTRFRFLNEEHEIDSAYGWNSPKLSSLWLYNLHYFDSLSSHGSSPVIAEQLELIQRWISENPPGVGIGWDPYPISLRVVNWIKWVFAGNIPTDEFLHSLAIQIRFLTKRLEYHLLGNHLLVNAKALIFGGLFFEGEEANTWFKTGLEIMGKQLKEQILADGGHFELSPMYHALILEDLLDLVNLFNAFDKTISDDWFVVIQRMIEWLKTMTHPDGEIAFFNDASLAVAPRLQDLTDYMDRLNIKQQRRPLYKQNFLKDSGYVRIGRGRMTLFADVGQIGPDYLPGHAHADTLSFELSLDKKRVVVNSGTSVYTDGEERLRQRGTAAHNTIRLDGIDSSEVWGAFRVAQRAKVFSLSFSDEILSATHDGYRRLPGKLLHHRSWSCAEKEIIITDKIFGEGEHLAEIFFHFHPDFTPRLEGSLMCLLCDSNGVPSLKMQLDKNFFWEIMPSNWHPQFGLSIPNYKIVGTYAGILPIQLVTSIY